MSAPAQTVYHFSTEKMREILGMTFAEFAAKRFAGNTAPEDIVDETFFKMRPYAVSNAADAITEASLNPVSPAHVLSFPAPEYIGAQKTDDGWTGMPEDGGFINISKEAVINTFRSLFDWTSGGYLNAPIEKPRDDRSSVAQSFWTANLGRAAYLAVPLLHVHHLMAFDEGTYEAFRTVDEDTDRFIRPLVHISPEELLRQAYDDKHGTDVVKKLLSETSYIDHQDVAVNNDQIKIVRPATVKRNDFRVDLEITKDAAGNSQDDIDALISAAYDVQMRLASKGAAGFTMVMDSTAIQSPSAAKDTGKLSMYFVTHMHGDPEWLKGGFVYTAQKYTAPSMRQMKL